MTWPTIERRSGVISNSSTWPGTLTFFQAITLCPMTTHSLVSRTWMLPLRIACLLDLAATCLIRQWKKCPLYIRDFVSTFTAWREKTFTLSKVQVFPSLETSSKSQRVSISSQEISSNQDKLQLKLNKTSIWLTWCSFPRSSHLKPSLMLPVRFCWINHQTPSLNLLILSRDPIPVLTNWRFPNPAFYNKTELRFWLLRTQCPPWLNSSQLYIHLKQNDRSLAYPLFRTGEVVQTAF